MKKIILILIISFTIFSNVNANYIRNIDDDVKIYKIDKKIKTIIEKSKYKDEIKNILIQRISKLLGKTELEIYKIGNLKYYNLESFEEYALIKVYRYLSYGDLLQYQNSKVRVLENDFVRVLVTQPNLNIDNESLYYKRDDGVILKMIEFYKIDKNKSIEENINDNFIGEKYKGKCRAYIKTVNSISFTNNTVYGIGAYGDYIPKVYDGIGDIPDCGYYGDSTSIKYFEVKGDYLFYINAGQDYIGVDFSLIELKN